MKREIRRIIGTILGKRRDLWKADENHKFKVDHQVVTSFFNKKLSIDYSKDETQKEKEAIFPFMNINLHSRVLDIGCGDGRWANDIVDKCKEYVGVDLASKCIEIARKSIPNTNAKFICMPAQEYRVDEEYDLILVIGLMTCLNDEDIIQLSSNCRRMLKKEGRLIVRNVTLRNTSYSRHIYNYKPNVLLRLLRDPAYQIIRRSREEELSFFINFRLIHEQQIEGTGYTLYVFE